MYNKAVIDKLIDIIRVHNGIADKYKLSVIVIKEFSLTKNRSVYSCKDFSIRFSKSQSKKMCNTVLALSVLKKYDDRPFFVCIVTKSENYLLLSNSSFLKKISHSSKELRIDNIKGSFNGVDIMMEYNGMENTPDNFEEMYAFHSELTFQDNLERLVESTNEIVGRNQKFNVTDVIRKNIMDSVQRTQEFLSSDEYIDLKWDLDERVSKYQAEIRLSALISNIKDRGNLIEYLITDNDTPLKEQIINALHNDEFLPEFKIKDDLGDFSKEYPIFRTETDIKSKILLSNGNPKAYNIDKLLEFLSDPKAIYMIYLIGLDNEGNITTKLFPALDSRLIDCTVIQHHWAGRNTRGVTQFLGNPLKELLYSDNDPIVDSQKAQAFLEELINR